MMFCGTSEKRTSYCNLHTSAANVSQLLTGAQYLCMTILFSGLFIFAGSALAASFPDVDSNHAHFQAIEFLKSRGVIQGYPDGTFGPELPINRAESLKILLLGSGVEVPDAVDTVNFTDFSASDWFSIYIEKARDLSIVEGYSDGRFRPSQTVNLVEYLKMLILTNTIDLDSLYPDPPSQMPFSDTPLDSWYIPYIRYAKDIRLVEADLDGNISPGQPMTRALFSEIMYRFMSVREYGLQYFDAQEPMVLSAMIEETEFTTEEDLTQSFADEITEFGTALEDEDESVVIDYSDLWAELGF